jgi:uncharacterized protein
MVEFSKLVAEQWDIPDSLATTLCSAFENKDMPYYLGDYVPTVVAQIETSQVWRIYDYLQDIANLAPKKKRLINAMKKAGTLTDPLQKRIELTVNSYEIDDLLLPCRANPRSKAQMALKKGLKPLADIIEEQGEENESVETLAQPYVGKHESLKSVDDVVGGVKDILAERFAYDETVRAMAREFAYEDGYVEVNLKSKKEKLFPKLAGKSISIKEIDKETLLKLFHAEEQKRIRFKLTVQLFMITELLRHHFIKNPDSVGFDILCEVIDDCWQRLLQPVVERDVKQKLRNEADGWALDIIGKALDEQLHSEQFNGVLIAINIGRTNHVSLVAIGADGRLVAAAVEKKPITDKPILSDRLRQFDTRYRPSRIVIPAGDKGTVCEEIVQKSLINRFNEIQIQKAESEEKCRQLAESTWMKDNCADLEEGMRVAYSAGLLNIQPVHCAHEIGIRYFAFHPLIQYVTEEKLKQLFLRRSTELALHKGVVYKNVAGSPVQYFDTINSNMLQKIQEMSFSQELKERSALMNIEGMDETRFRNIAGYILFPESENVLDRTLVHPAHYSWLIDITQQMNISMETLVSDPDVIGAEAAEDPVVRIFIEKRLRSQIRVGQRFLTVRQSAPKRKLKLTELEEGIVVSGRVTNITPFGVFVNVNAVCDGLIHISQLADGYVETPEQVVSLNDKVDVRILRVDAKKRRISLSMKNLGTKTPKIKPSKNQLSDLAEYFRNR